MAPVKPLGVSQPGVTGFYQEYNQEPGPRQDLNPDVVTSDSELPKPLPVKNVAPKPIKVPKAAKAKK